MRNKAKSIAAIITARGGSKGVPRKNLRMLAGKPLIAHSILAALHCNLISKCVVSTEDQEIAEVSREWGAEIIERPSELAGDMSSSIDVVLHALDTLKKESCLPDYFVLLQPTSPIRNEVHLNACIEKFFTSNMKSALSVTEVEHHPYKSFYMENECLVPLFDNESLHKPRQLLPKVYRSNGAIYMMESTQFMESRTFFVEPAMPFIMSSEDSIDIDTELDFIIAESIINSRT